MIALTVGEIAALLGATPTGPIDPATPVTALTADSRTAGPGALFVALPGDRVDGHAFAATAYAQGAAAALTARPVEGVGCLVVSDPLLALGRLARQVVDRARSHGLAVVGITGSQGKTSTKDLLAQVLERSGPTVAPVGNLNNELGVPLTIGRIEPDTRYLVAEMGARGIGHIAYLCGIAAPEVGVVLNVGHAHVGEFGGRDAIAVAKGELVEALPPTGRAVLNADDPLVWAMRTRTAAPVLAYAVGGQPAGPAVWADNLVSDALGRYAFRLASTESEADVEVQLQVTGRHQVANAAAAAAAATALGLALPEIGSGLAAAVARSRWRMEMHPAAAGVLVINDAYNANPDSMRAALATAAELGRSRRGRVRVVLGDMLELGADAPGQHAEIGRYAAELAVNQLVAIGAHAEDLVRAARAAGLGSATVAPDRGAATRTLLEALQPDDVVLVKASRGLALDTVAEQILSAWGDPTGESSQ